MPYCTIEDVKFWGQLDDTSKLGGAGDGYDYTNSIQRSIEIASNRIDDYCEVPKGFFEPGGVEIQKEYHDGARVIYTGKVTRFYAFDYGGLAHLKTDYTPVLSVTKLEEETSAGSWTTRTEGSNDDYVVVDDGVRYVKNVPTWKWKNVRITYKAGYKETPQGVIDVCGELAAAILHKIIDAQKRSRASSGGASTEPTGVRLTDTVFTKDMKLDLKRYRQSNGGGFT